LATLLQNELNIDVARFTTLGKNLAALFGARQVRTWVAMVSNVAKQVAIVCCPFYSSFRD